MTIAVVGHGRSPEGRRWGYNIDACKTVVRMWDWHWQNECDFGENYDYGLLVVTPKGLSIFNAHNKKIPRRGWLVYLGKPTAGVLPNERRCEILDTATWVDLGRRLGGAGLTGELTLTRGCAAAAWAIQRDNRVILVGFDNVKCGINQPIENSFNPDYWNMYISRFKNDTTKHYPIGSSKTNTHDMAIELPLLKHLASVYKTELVFAEDVW